MNKSYLALEVSVFFSLLKKDVKKHVLLFYYYNMYVIMYFQ